MVRPGARRRPARAHPPRHAHNLGCLIQRDHDVDLAVGVRVVLPAVDLLAVHVDGSDAEIARLFGRCEHAAAAVFGPVQLDVRGPAFFEALAYALADVVVVGCAWAVVLV